jgi:hypothetical protein
MTTYDIYTDGEPEGFAFYSVGLAVQEAKIARLGRLEKVVEVRQLPNGEVIWSSAPVEQVKDDPDTVFIQKLNGGHVVGDSLESTDDGVTVTNGVVYAADGEKIGRAAFVFVPDENIDWAGHNA